MTTDYRRTRARARVKSLPFEDIEPARLWALQHAGRTRHDDYREAITRPWRALPAEGASL
ncbi:hypothetical protein [Actinacidiphila oryziradicis]|jgi:hypothetical protein|uniref:DUF7848 domain-containing protein n=1 Tax=Actinacidiphila oryziradicis TaxID=2571141 RepID=UPI0023EFAD5C|nr:hypothetical protein [Actinacidiphila oryziradicis]MCW2871460.1 hypothetical protein [Actinacidiphila oryziradicis]